MKKIDLDSKKVIDMYINDFNSLSQIGEGFKVSKTVIARILKSNKVELRKRTTKYRYNQDIFQDIDTEEKAYWLGFLAADGCVYQRESSGSVLIVNLAEKDRGHLEKLKSFIGDGKIERVAGAGYGQGTFLYRLSVNSNKIVSDLIKHKVPPKKSLILEPPTTIPKDLIIHWIRGYMDGDGSIYKSKSIYVLSFNGTLEVMTYIKDFFGITSKMEKRWNDDKNTYSFRIGGTNYPHRICSIIYANSTIYMERKKAVFDELDCLLSSTKEI